MSTLNRRVARARPPAMIRLTTSCAYSVEEGNAMSTFNSNGRMSRNRTSLYVAGVALMAMLNIGVQAQSNQTGASTATSSSNTSNGPGGTATGSRTNDRNLNPIGSGYNRPWYPAPEYPRAGQLSAPQRPAVYDGMGRKSVPEPYIAPATPERSGGNTNSGGGSSAKPRRCRPGAAC
jgi:hypothetical protein